MYLITFYAPDNIRKKFFQIVLKLPDLPEKTKRPTIYIPGLFDFVTTEIINALPNIANIFAVRVGLWLTDFERAIQVFYRVKGGQEDFGVYRPDLCGCRFNRYGRKHKGRFKEWDENNPITLISHSQGSGTCLYLQILLEKNNDPTSEFYNLLVDENGKPYKTSAKWIRNYLTIAASHNGSTILHFFSSLKDGNLTYGPNDYFFLFFNFLFQFIVGAHNFGKKYNIPFIANFFDPNIDHRDNSSLEKLIINKKNCSYLQALAVNSVYERNKQFSYSKHINYQHIKASTTFKDGDFQTPYFVTGILFSISAYIIGHTTDVKEFMFDNFDAKEWRENDGATSTISQGLINWKENEKKYKDRIVIAETDDEMWELFKCPRKLNGKIMQFKLNGIDHLQISMFGIIFNTNILYNLRFIGNYFYMVKQLEKDDKIDDEMSYYQKNKSINRVFK